MSGLLPLRGVLNTLITSSIWYLRNLNYLFLVVIVKFIPIYVIPIV